MVRFQLSLLLLLLLAFNCHLFACPLTAHLQPLVVVVVVRRPEGERLMRKGNCVQVDVVVAVAVVVGLSVELATVSFLLT